MTSGELLLLLKMMKKTEKKAKMMISGGLRADSPVTAALTIQHDSDAAPQNAIAYKVVIHNVSGYDMMQCNSMQCNGMSCNAQWHVM